MIKYSVPLLLLTLSCRPPAPETVPLWPEKVPGSVTAEAETRVSTDGVLRAFNVSFPVMQVYPASGHGIHPAVLVCPGGGYSILAMDLEGSEIARWLNTLGFSAFVLAYRVPDNREGALQDARRAMRILRSRSAEWSIDPIRIGVIGFSAGGNLAARLAGGGDSTGAYPLQDSCDAVSALPDFAMLVYPAWLIDDAEELAPDMSVTADHPPAFLVHAQDDWIPVQTSLLYCNELRKAGVSAELHLFRRGGHGFGLRQQGAPTDRWPDLAAVWLGDMGIIQ
ncbi:alpha/beta hydrolase [bacterium]|nr:alpha/beta hydrolase [bacterium]